MGSVTSIHYNDHLLYSIDGTHNAIHDEDIDMIIWWSPCQDLSIAKKDRKWLQWEKSWLFFEYVRLLKEIKPKYFLLENVASMKKADKEEITRVLTEVYPDVQCYLINSALVSAQNRKRLYWTNIQWVEQPEDKWIVLKDILEECVGEKYIIKADGLIAPNKKRIIPSEHELQVFKEWRTEEWRLSRKIIREQTWCDSTLRSKEHKAYFWREWVKANCITTGLWAEQMIWVWIRQSPRWFNKWWLHIEKSPTLSSCGWEQNNKLHSWWVIRKVTPLECERLQTLPDNYTEGVSNTQRYKAIGNGWTVDVISHIFSYLK